MRKTPIRLALTALLFSATGLLHAEPQQCPPPSTAPTPAQIAAAAAAAGDHGLLWRVTRDGHSSYVYGTLHVGRLAWAVPGPALREAWAATDTLAVELDIRDPQTIRALTTDAPKLTEPLGAALQQRLAAQTKAACLPPEALASLHPLMQATTLALLAGRWDELDAGYAQEAVLLGLAQQQQRRVEALERPEEQLDALIPKDPKLVRRAIAEALSQLEKQQVRAPMLRLAKAWADSDLALLQHYEQWCDCVKDDEDRRYLHGLLDARNPVLAARFTALHAGGQRVLGAVGALHLVGPRGLPALLEQAGFKVERLLP